MTRSSQFLVCVAIAPLILLAAYPISYLVLMERHAVIIVNLGIVHRVQAVSYGIDEEIVDEELVHVFFRPMHDLDCWIRPDAWASEDVGENSASVGGFF